MLIRSEYGLFSPSLWVKISLQFLPPGETTTTLFVIGYLTKFEWEEGGIFVI
jgi:hypothetical protein